MKEFLIKMLSSGDDISSKRVIGILCISTYILIFAMSFFIQLSEIQIEMSNQLLYVGGSLLGLGILDKLKNNNKQTN